MAWEGAGEARECGGSMGQVTSTRVKIQIRTSADCVWDSLSQLGSAKKNSEKVTELIPRN